MKRLAIPLALAILAFGSHSANGATITGDLNNFDTLNDTGQTCYGFEIEIDDVHSTDITYTFDWNHYGAPKIREDNTDSFIPRCSSVTRAPRIGDWVVGRQRQLHQRGDPDDHAALRAHLHRHERQRGLRAFRRRLLRYPDRHQVQLAGGRWRGQSRVLRLPRWRRGADVCVHASSGSRIAGANVVAAIPAPVVPIPAGKQFGEPSWVKVIKTKSHNANAVALPDLISDDADDDGKADWQNGEPDEVEIGVESPAVQ